MIPTERFSLPQWAADDYIRCEDFNAAFATIESAMAKVVIGTYVGDSAALRTIDLGFTPRAVLVSSATGQMTYSDDGITYYWGGLALAGSDATAVGIVEGGFTVKYNISYSTAQYYQTNTANTTYHYIAIY